MTDNRQDEGYTRIESLEDVKVLSGKIAVGGQNERRPKARRRLKAAILITVFITAFSSFGGFGTAIALVLLATWLFLDVQDSTVEMQPEGQA